MSKLTLGACRDEQEEEEEDLVDSNVYTDNYEDNIGKDDDKDSILTQEEEEDVEEDKDEDIKRNDFLSAQGDLQDCAAVAAASAAQAIADNINSLAVPTADGEDL